MIQANTRDQINQNALEALCKDLENGVTTHADYKIIRRLKERTHYADALGAKVAKGAIVDVETTGLNADQDKIIELGIIVFEFDPNTGVVFRITDKYSSFQDPGIPIPPESTQIHHITDDMVAGKQIDLETVTRLVSETSLIISHNARFDRPFLEKQCPVFAELQWACSLSQIDWREEGIGSGALEFIAYRYGFFFDGHRSEIDCLAVLEILAQPTPKSQQPGLKILLAKQTQRDWTVFALKSRFETKDILKARKYMWDPKQNVWFNTVSGSESIKNEIEWLKREIYNGQNIELGFEERDSYTKFSKRNGRRFTKTV
jgi:DNA polymerase-3 subunit epsilon